MTNAMRLALFTVAAVTVTSFNYVSAQKIEESALRQIRSLILEKESRTPAQKKIGSQLWYAVKMRDGQRLTEEVASLRLVDFTKDNTGRIKVDMEAVVTPALLDELRALGAVIDFSSVRFGNIVAHVPLDKMEQVAMKDGIKHIEPWLAPMNNSNFSGKLDNYKKINTAELSKMETPLLRLEEPVFIGKKRPDFATRAANVRRQISAALAQMGEDEFRPFVGSVTSEADATHKADLARSAFAVNGTGVKIGVLSDGVSGFATSQASGDLPPVITILPGMAGSGSEGRAMMELIYDLAPGAELYFATAFISQASFAQNILDLRAAGCDIIVDDVTYFAETVFQDDNVSQAVNTVTASGALFFSSAGNSGNKNDNTSGVWEGDFTDGGVSAAPFPLTGNLHDFSPGVPFNVITANTGVITLKWSDPRGLSANDYDIFVTNSTGTTIVTSSTSIQDGNDNPYEAVGARNAGERIYILKKTGAAVRALHLNTNRGQITHNTPGVVYGHNAAGSAYTVAATPASVPNSRPGSTTGPFPGPHNSTNKVEVFSSDGPRRMFFNPDGSEITPGNLLFGTNGGTVLQKPDITAADGTVTVTPGFTRFYGTSAAAPHAAAIAALIKSAVPAITPAQVRTALINSAIDIEDPGDDRDAGAGIIMAYEALLAAGATAFADLVAGTVTATEGTFSNSNGIVEPGELASLTVQLVNNTPVSATAVSAVLTTSTPGVTITQGTATYGTIAGMGNASNTGTPYLFAVNSSVPCGTAINFILTVSFGGGITSPKTINFQVKVGSLPITIAATIGTAPPAGVGYTAVSGQQTGRINRFSPVSVCGVAETNPGLAATTGSREYHAYTFSNPSAATVCTNITMNSATGQSLFTASYNNAGFVPATPSTNWLADPGGSSTAQAYSHNVPAGQPFTIVVHDVNPTTPPASSNSAYTLTVDMPVCATPPACTPVVVSPGSIPAGNLYTPYSQSFSATGGSGSYTFSLTGALPGGMSFSGTTLSGTPTASGSFPITVTATDLAGCPAGTQNLTLTINPDAGACNELFISEYVEGSSNNKAIEIYNPTASTITLTGNYQVRVYSNGSPTPSATINLVGSIAPYDVFVLANTSAVLGITPDQTSGSLSHNGNDAIELYKNSTAVTVDVIGQIGINPGTEWGTGLTSTADNTIRRKFAINKGDANGADAFDPATEWDGFAIDVFTGLGAHSNACACLSDINLQGAGIDIPNGSVSPILSNHTDFGSVTSCAGTVVRTFTIQNTGSRDLVLPAGAITVSGTHASLFAIGGITLPITIAPAGSATFTVTFDPDVFGLKTATVQVAHNDCDENPYQFAIQGTGSLPKVNILGNGNLIADGDITPSVNDLTEFGSRSACSGTIVRSFTIYNSGNANLNFSPLVISGTHAADFTVTVTPTSPVAPSGTTNFSITFDPSSPGLRTATVTLNSDACDIAAYDFVIQGTGTDPDVNVQGNGITIVDGSATPSPADHTDFGSESVCTGVIVRTFTIQNTGNANLTLANPTLSGPAAADFSITANPVSPVLPAGSTTFQVTFNPSAVGLRSATVTFTNNDCDAATYDFAIQGTGADPEINVLGNSIAIPDGFTGPILSNHTAFGDQSVCTGSVIRTYTIENGGSDPLSVTGITISGTGASSFTAGGIILPATILPAGSATFTVTFDPSSAGLKTATVNIDNNDCDESLYNFDINGTGIDPEMDVTGNSVSIADGDNTPSLTDHTEFGTVNIGSTMSRTYTISNTGNVDLVIPAGGITFVGGDGALFTLSGITLPASVPPAGSANFVVTFTPTSGGIKTTSLTIANNDCNENPYNYSIQGTGFDQCANGPVISCGTPVTATFSGPGLWNTTVCGFSTPGQENIYRFTPTTSGVYTLQVTAASGIYVDYFYKAASAGCGPTGWTCIDDVIIPGVVSFGPLTAGTEYYILLDAESTTGTSQTFLLQCLCPTMGTLVASPSPLCEGNNVTLSVSGLTGMNSGPYGITFKTFNAPTADPYSGGAEIATIFNPGLGAGGTTATFTTSPLAPLATGTHYLYAVLTPTPVDAACRPSATTTLVVNAKPTGAISFTETSGLSPNDGTICLNASVTLAASVSASYSWSTGATTQAITVAPAVGNTPYTVTVTNASGCTSTFSATVNVNPLPTAHMVQGGGAYCSGGTGPSVTLSGSDASTNYQLRLNGNPVGSPVPGTGSSISFGAQGGVGTYTVIATNTTTGCSNTMTGSVTVAAFSCTPSITDPCTCLNNATSLTDGQFSETITVNGPPGDTWTVTAVNGLYTMASPAPPAAPIPVLVGATMTEGPAGVYTLQGKHIDALGYTITVVNGRGFPLSIGNTCEYPNPVITGLATLYCQDNTPITLTGTPGDANIISQSFAVNGVPAVSFTPATPGVYKISYTVNGGAPKAFGPADPGCIQTVSKFVSVYPVASVNQPADQVVCNNTMTAPVSFVSPVPNTVFNWVNSNPAIGLAANGTGNIPAFTGLNPGVTPVTGTVTITPVASAFAYIPNFGSSNVSVIDLANNTVSATIPLPANDASGVSVSPDGQRVYITHYSNPGSVDVINTATNTLTATIPLSNGPFAPNVSPDGSRVFVPNQGSNTVSVINTATNAITATIPTPFFPGPGKFSRDGTRYYMTHAITPNGRLTIIDPVSNTVIGSFNPAGIGDATTTLEVSPDGTVVYIGSQASTFITRFSTATNTIIGTIPTGFVTYQLLLNADGTRLYASNGNGASVSVINTATNTVITTIPVGNAPEGLSLTADGAFLYVANGGSNTVSVINTATNTVVATVPVGTAPFSSGNFISGPSCPGPAKSFTYTVNPTPNAVATPASQAICTGSAITPINLTGNVAGTVFNWTRDNMAGVGGIAANGTGNTITGTLTSLTGLPEVVNFTITPTYTNAGVTCTGTPIMATVQVNLGVSGDINTPGLSVCAGNGTSIPVYLGGTPNFNGVFSITVLNGPGVPTPAFNWTATVNGPSSVNIPAANLTNTGTTPVTYRVSWVSLSDASGCPLLGLTGFVNVTVYPVPTIQVSAAPVGDVCPGTAVNFTVSNPNGVPGALYNVEVKDATNAVLQSLPNQPFGVFNYSNNSCNVNNPITATFTPIGPAPGYCYGIPVTRTFTIRDITAPVLAGTLPGGNLGNACLNAVPAAPTTTAIRNLYTDNCTSTANLTVTLGTTITTGNNCGWTVTYPFTVTDACGNTTAASVTYTGADTQAPTWTTTPASLNRTVNCSDAAGLAAAQALVPVATDNCASAGTLSTNTVKTAGVFAQTSAGTCTSAGTITNTFTTHDGCGNVSAVYTQVITITDNVGPVLSSPTPQTLDVGNAGNCTAILPDYRPLVTATDCTPVTMTQSPAPGTSVVGSVGPGPVGGSVIVTITATDGCGNVSTRNITVNLVDVTPPVARCHNITVNLNAAGNVQVVPSQIDGNGPAPSFNPKSSDNCGLNSYNQGLTFQGPHPLFSNDISRNYTCANLGPNAITLIVTDVSGNTSTCNATITVRDITPPAFNCPANFNVPKGPLCTNILTDITAGIPVTDACGPITLTQNPAPGTVIASDVNSLPVTVTATDGSGNSSSCTTTVTFTDQTPPVLLNCPANITVTTGVGNTDCNAPATWTPPTATDNCSPALGATTITSTHTPGQLFFAGVTTVTYTATDAAGNTSTCSFTVTVIENTLPTITCNSPGNKTVNANNGSCGYLHTGTSWDASGTDNCIPILAGTYTLTGATTGTGTTLNGRTFNGGTTTVTWRVTDQSGNSTTCSYTVTVNDTQAPSITCPATITVNANASGCRGAVPGIQTTPVVSDNCGIALIEWSVSGATPISSGIGNLGDYFFNLGTSLVTYRVSDAAGNSTICTFNVIVNNAVQGSILGTSTTPQNASTTSTITFTGTGGQAPYTFTYSMNGGPVQTVSTSPVSNTTTVAQSNAVVGTYAYTLLSVTDGNGCAGTITPPPTATVTVTIGSMDLTNSQFFSTTQIVNGGAIDEVIGIRNVGSMATTAPIVFSVTNYAAITGLTAVSNNNPSVTIGFTTYTLDNANWTVNVTPSAITFTSNAGIVINPGQTRFLGIRITRSGGANGTVTNSATIIGGTGGGESPTNNNSISNTLLKN